MRLESKNQARFADFRSSVAQDLNRRFWNWLGRIRAVKIENEADDGGSAQLVCDFDTRRQQLVHVRIKLGLGVAFSTHQAHVVRTEDLDWTGCSRVGELKQA